MTLKHFHAATIAVFTLLAASLPASATLMIDVTGTAGSGTSTWTFSGSSTVASGSAGFCGSNCDGIFGTTLFDNTGWVNVGNYISVYNGLTIPASSSTASVSVNGGTAQAIDRLFLDHDAANADDFGIGVVGADLLFSATDIISWSGALIMPVDFGALAPDGVPASFTTSDFLNSAISGAGAAGLAITLNIGEASVPEPTALALIGLGLAGLGYSRKRKAA